MSFASKLIDWHLDHGRHDLPWQLKDSPYTTWLSEVMLQQTQVTTVIPYFNAFINRWPSVLDLANADVDEVLSMWSGLGYYSRARNLHKAAQMIVTQFEGEFPSCAQQLETLPGVGKSTAAAIKSLAFKQPAAIMDGNVKRVLTRLKGIEGWPGQSAINKQLWALAESLAPSERCDLYTQAIMDLGATLCTRSKPKCTVCPFADTCVANRQSLQSRLPTPKPKKTKPLKQCYWLMTQNSSGEWLVERRTGKGVWQDLYAPKQYDELDELIDSEQLDDRMTQVLEPFKHHFSHYSLLIHPVRYTGTLEINESQRWYSAQSDMGVPSAFTKLLDEEHCP